MMMGRPILEVRDLRKSYGTNHAVDGVSFEVLEGEVFGILGPNGAGKTTTLEIIEGLRRPDSGQIILDGLDALAEAQAVKEIIGVQLQATALFERLTVEETIKLFASFYKRTANVEELLKWIQLESKRSDFVPGLSGGQKQRLSIGLALVNEPRIVFLDEPTTGLDPQARRNLWDVCKEVAARGITIVITTHYMEEAEVLCDRIAIMDAGHIIALDTPAALVRSLKAGATVEFDQDGVPLDLINSLPTVTGIRPDNGRVFVFTEIVDRTLTEILSLARTSGFELHNLLVRGATLEDVFLTKTGHSLRD
jgi:ABC-2 type transport system ATP-binding protein